MKKITKFVLAGLLVAPLLGFAAIKVFLWNEYRLIRDRGFALSTEVEQFRSHTGRLPNDLDELRAGKSQQDLDLLFYQKMEDGTYRIWAPEGLDGCYMLNLNTKKWSFSCS